MARPILKQVCYCPRCGKRTVHEGGVCLTHPGPAKPASAKPRSDADLLRVLFVAPGLWMGGVERWMSSMCRGLCSDRFQIAGVAHFGKAGDDVVDWFPRSVSIVPWSPLLKYDIAISWGLLDLVKIVKRVMTAGVPPIWVDVQHGAKMTSAWQRPLVEAASEARRQFGIGVVGVSSLCADNFPDDVRGSVMVIPNGAEPDRLLATASPAFIRRKFKIPENKKVVLFVARISYEKQPQLFLDAVKQLGPEYFGVMAGPNAAKLKLDVPPNVVLVGAQSNIGNLMSVADVFCLPSEGEGHGLSVNEAWLAGVPTVTTAYDTIRRQSEEWGELSLQVPLPGDATELAAALRAATEDSERNLLMVERAHRVAYEQFSSPVMCRRWSDYLWQLAGNKND